LKQITIVAIVIIAITIVTAGTFAYLTYGSGTLEIQVTDPPADWNSATGILLNYSAIEVHKADAADNQSGWQTVISTSGVINLTQMLDVNKTLGSGGLQAGKYNLIRFSTVKAIVTIGNVNYTATVPPDKLQVAITQGGIQIGAGRTSRLLIDLNIRVEGTIENGLIVVPDIRATPI